MGKGRFEGDGLDGKVMGNGHVAHSRPWFESFESGCVDNVSRPVIIVVCYQVLNW